METGIHTQPSASIPRLFAGQTEIKTIGNISTNTLHDFLRDSAIVLPYIIKDFPSLLTLLLHMVTQLLDSLLVQYIGFFVDFG